MTSPTLTEKPIERLYFHLPEVAKALGCNASAVRYWEREFDLDTTRNRKGDRRLTVKEIGQIALISRLVKWFHIEKAKQIYRAGKAEQVMDILEPGYGKEPQR